MPQMLLAVDTGYTLTVTCETTPTVITGDTGVNQPVDHNFSAAGNVTFTGDLDKVTYFKWIGSANITGDVKIFAKFLGMKFLRIYTTSMYGSSSSFSGLTSMVQMIAYSSSITGDVADFSTMPNLTLFWVYLTSIDTYTQGVLPDWGDCDIRINDLGLDQTESNNFVIDGDNGVVAGGHSKTWIMTGNTALSGAAIASAISLAGKGVTVNSD